jgi:hypothetical protein
LWGKRIGGASGEPFHTRSRFVITSLLSLVYVGLATSLQFYLGWL